MYYDIDDLLCEDLEVQIRLNAELFRGNELDPHFPGETLPVDHKVRLPFWLAKYLSTIPVNKKPLCDIEVPEMFCQDF